MAKEGKKRDWLGTLSALGAILPLVGLLVLNVGRMFTLAGNYFYERQEPDYGAALHSYQAAALVQNPEGEYRLAYMYENGIAVPADDWNAQKYYARAYNHGIEIIPTILPTRIPERPQEAGAGQAETTQENTQASPQAADQKERSLIEAFHWFYGGNYPLLAFLLLMVPVGCMLGCKSSTRLGAVLLALFILGFLIMALFSGHTLLYGSGWSFPRVLKLVLGIILTGISAVMAFGGYVMLMFYKRQDERKRRIEGLAGEKPRQEERKKR